MTYNPQLIRGAVITVIIAAVIGIISVFTISPLGGNSEISVKLAGICFSLIIYGITAAICMVATEKPVYKGLGTAGIVVSAIGFLLAVILIFSDGGDEPSIAKTSSSLFLAAVGLAHISLLLHFNLRNRHAHNARMTAIIFISIFTLVLITIIFSERKFDLFGFLGEGLTMVKMLLVTLLADLAATLLVPLCNRLPADEQPTLNFEKVNELHEAEPQLPQKTQQAEEGNIVL